ncbi:hypothetical protein B0T10DRAFT_284867 [Thelonectria olida]|uniref:Uncharacterized protein n=1 Tax=Thelonectria olida TaxID=1576542 RepID=A0A9P8W7P0_9HYPO|nr:hypothetical protein B0T10DRAFT_284867 [Thelonectria olida]
MLRTNRPVQLISEASHARADVLFTRIHCQPPPLLAYITKRTPSTGWADHAWNATFQRPPIVWDRVRSVYTLYCLKIVNRHRHRHITFHKLHNLHTPVSQQDAPITKASAATSHQRMQRKRKKKREDVVVHGIGKGSLQEAPSGGVGKPNAASALGTRAWTSICRLLVTEQKLFLFFSAVNSLRVSSRHLFFHVFGGFGLCLDYH